MNGAAVARPSDPRTSHQAAELITPQLTAIQRRVLSFAQERGGVGFTDPELNLKFNSRGSSYRSRRAELRDKGYIYDTGQTKPFYPDSRREHVIWAVTLKGWTVNLNITGAI